METTEGRESKADVDRTEEAQKGAADRVVTMAVEDPIDGGSTRFGILCEVARLTVSGRCGYADRSKLEMLCGGKPKGRRGRRNCRNWGNGREFIFWPKLVELTEPGRKWIPVFVTRLLGIEQAVRT